MYGLPLLDIAVILVYFAGMIGIGVWSMRRIHDQEDYFLGGRRFGKLIQTFAAFGQSTTADNSVGVVTTTFTNGAAGIWSSLLYLPGTPLYWMVSPWMRRLRVLTLGDFYHERYGSRRLAATYAVLGSICMMAYLSVGFSAMSKTIVALTPKEHHELTVDERTELAEVRELAALSAADWNGLDETERTRLATLRLERPRAVFSHIDKDVLIWVVCLIVLVYTVAGGLTAAFISDTVQGVFIIILTFLLLPFGWMKINRLYGGEGIMAALRTVHDRLPESYFEVFGSPAALDFTWYYIVAIGALAALNTTVQPNMLVATGSAKDEYTARFGFTTGVLMKRFCTVFWGFFALSAIVLYSGVLNDPDLVWGYATRDLLGPLDVGLVGLMIACLTAALMSTADCLMVTCASLLTQNLYKPFSPGRSEAHYVLVGRIMGAMVVIGGALIATQFDTILQLLKFIWEFNVMLAASFWLGMKWRRANRVGAWASIVVTMLLFFVLPALIPAAVPGLRSNPTLLKMTDPQPMVRTYTSREMDVSERDRLIVSWDEDAARGESVGTRPVRLEVGERFEKTFVLEQRSIFWTRGMQRDEQGMLAGVGSLNLGLVALDLTGADLGSNLHALNQTLRLIIRIVLPFIILITVSLLTRRDERALLDRFFVKMKTKVIVDRATDDVELAKSYADPRRFDHFKLFPGTDWEFDRWDREDTVGFVLTVIAVLGIVGLLFFLVGLGSHTV